MVSEQSQLTANVVEVGKTYINTRQELIVITRDKAELCLMKHAQKLEQQRGWIAPMSLAIPVFATLLTSDFKASFGIDAGTWRGVFIVVFVLALGWFAYAGWRARGLKTAIDDLLAELAKEPPATSGTPVADTTVAVPMV